MRFVKHLLTYTGILISLIACNKVNDLGIRPLGGAVTEVKIQECDIRAVSYSDGLKMTVGYNERLPVEVTGIQYFNKLQYRQGSLDKLENTAIAGWKISINQDSRENITKLAFEGRDGTGRLTTESYEMTYDQNDQLIKMLVDIPIFLDPIELAFEYDQKGNIKKIKRKSDTGDITVLENQQFDDKKAPFTHQKQLGQLMSYLLAMTAINGEANYTYFLNTNNVTKSVITNGAEKTELSATYEYIDEFPSKAQISKNYKGRLSALTETYAYNCQ